MVYEEFSNWANELINKGEGIKRHKSSGQEIGFQAACLSFIEKLYSSSHSYYLTIKETKFIYVGGSDSLPHVELCLAVLSNIKNEINSGWIEKSVKGLVSAEIFSDFLDMAGHLLERGYKDPAAVIIGSTLEEHLRKLCNKHRIETERHNDNQSVPKKADSLNSDLAREGIINKLDQKSITAWLGLRNHAAHGEYEKYTKEQAAEMLQGVRSFITRNPL